MRAFYVLKLFVAGMSPASMRAISHIKDLCDNELYGYNQLEVIDAFQRPELLSDAQIIALPTLIREQPLPKRRIIGDLSDKKQLLIGLEIEQEEICCGNRETITTINKDNK